MLRTRTGRDVQELKGVSDPASADLMRDVHSAALHKSSVAHNAYRKDFPAKVEQQVAVPFSAVPSAHDWLEDSGMGGQPTASARGLILETVFSQEA